MNEPLAAALGTCREEDDMREDRIREKRESNLHLYFMAIMSSRTVCLQTVNQLCA